MSFTLDENSLLIKGRRGYTASFTFNLNRDISAYTVYFYVKKNIWDADSKMIISKEYPNPTTTFITVNLTTEDTEKLSTQSNSYSTYYWGLKISNGNEFAQTLIPQDFKTPPMMYIYPEIGGI